MNRFGGIVGFLIVTTSLWAPVIRADDGVTDKEIVIGSCADLEGPTKSRGKEQKEAVQAYFDQVNKRGGVNGRKLRLLSHDDSYDPYRAPSCFAELMKEEAFMGAYFIGSGPGVKYAIMAQSHKMPILGINGGPEFLYTPVKHYVFNVRSSYFDQTEQAINHLWNDVGARRIAVVYQDDAYGASIWEATKKTLEKLGGTPVLVDSFPRPNKQGVIEGLPRVIDDVKASHPDAVILGGVGSPDAKIVGELRKTGMEAVYVAITNDPKYYKSGVAEGTVMIQPFPPIERKDLPAVMQYTRLLKQSFPKSEATSVGLEAFVDTKVIVEALRRAGKELTRESFIEALETLHDFDVGLGPASEDKVNFDAGDHKGLHIAYVTIVQDGQPVVLTDWKRVSKS